MIKFDIENIKDLCKEALSEVDLIEDTFDKFKLETEELLDTNDDEKVFPAIEKQMDEVLPKMKGLVVEDIRHIFTHIENSMDKVESIDNQMKKGINFNEN